MPWLCVLGVSSILAFAGEIGLERTLSNGQAEAQSSESAADPHWVPRTLLNAGADCDYMCLSHLAELPALSAAELFAVADRR